LVIWSQWQILEEIEGGMKIGRMLMVEECCLRLCDHSDAGRVELSAWQRRGGTIAPGSRNESIVTIVNNSPAAAHRMVVQKNQNMSKMQVLWDSTLAHFPPSLYGP
jgi:hypothetical protein